jgi:hypothetical protein
VLSAHLDGYGYGEPVDGDGLYNGAFDDAAYVATLVRLAEQRKGKGFRRSVLFAAWAAEEKGLHGSNWFVRHPTVPKEDLAAAINLDQLRPLFPLKILTQLAIDTSTLGADARAVGEEMGIRLRPDPEPERNLLRRSDHWPFLQIGVPATGFIFGYEPGTQAEARYKEWYRVRYHRPQDDITQPIDFVAARDFNSFFYKLADQPQREPERVLRRVQIARLPDPGLTGRGALHGIGAHGALALLVGADRLSFLLGTHDRLRSITASIILPGHNQVLRREPSHPAARIRTTAEAIIQAGCGMVRKLNPVASRNRPVTAQPGHTARASREARAAPASAAKVQLATMTISSQTGCAAT